MKRTMIRVVGATSFAAVLLVGCADSSDYGQGNASAPESGSASSTESSITNADPGVASESGTRQDPANQSSERQFNTLGSASAPSANVPANVATNGTDSGREETRSESEPEKVQGSQVSPEPQTGDDANPDQVAPER